MSHGTGSPQRPQSNDLPPRPLECGGSFTLLAPISRGASKGPPLLRLIHSASSSDLQTIRLLIADLIAVIRYHHPLSSALPPRSYRSTMLTMKPLTERIIIQQGDITDMDNSWPLRHSHRRDPHRNQRGRCREKRRRDRLSHRPQALLRDHHPQGPTWAACSLTCATKLPSARPTKPSRPRSPPRSAASIPGRHRAAHDQAVRLRTHHRLQHRPAVRSVLLFGMGGQLVEVFKDRALALPRSTPPSPAA